MDTNVLVDIFNTLSLWAFVFMSTIIAGRITYRALLFRKARQKLPLLLKRDLYLFGSVTTYVISILGLRLAGINGLNHNLPWLIFSNALLLGPFAYWAWIEWRQ